MAVCDGIEACVGINVTPGGCRYFSSVEGMRGDAGTVAFVRTPPPPDGYVPTPGGSSVSTITDVNTGVARREDLGRRRCFLRRLRRPARALARRRRWILSA